MRTVAMTTAITLKSMLPPMEREISSAACARSGGPGLGNFEGAAIDRSDIEDFAGLAGGAVRDLRVPECVAVLHTSVAGALVDPGVESGRLAEIQPLHARRAERLFVPMHPDDARDRDDRRADRLPDERSGALSAGYPIAPDGLGSSGKTLDYVYNEAAYDGHVAGQRYSGDTGIRDPLPPESSPSPEGRE